MDYVESAVLSRENSAVMAAWHDYENGILPGAGGMGDQAYSFSQAIRHLNGLMALDMKPKAEEAARTAAGARLGAGRPAVAAAPPRPPRVKGR